MTKLFSPLETAMPRPHLPAKLDPRKPRGALAWGMQTARRAHGVTQKALAAEFGCSSGHLSRVERGESTPSRSLAQFYDDRFDCEGMLMSLFEVVATEYEMERRRDGPRRLVSHTLPGDASRFVGDTVPHGSLMTPGAFFPKTWTIQNVGTVAWQGRRLERQGPRTGPGLITSVQYYPVPNAAPGDTVTIEAWLKAPTYDCASIAYFKMVHPDGRLCFPDRYQLGLDVLVLVRGQLPDVPLDLEPDPSITAETEHKGEPDGPT